MNQRASHGRKGTQIVQIQTLEREMKKIGFLYKLLNQPMHGGDSSTCPSRFSLSSGSINIVLLHCQVKHIIANDLYDNHDDNVCYKVKFVSLK